MLDESLLDWGTIKSVSPLMIKTDGAITPQPVDVNLSDNTWQVNDRVAWTHIGRKLAIFGGPLLRTYTPSLTVPGGGASNPTGWTCFGTYEEDKNHWVTGEASWVATSGSFTSGSGIYLLGLPVPVASNNINPVGQAVITNNDYLYMCVVHNGDGGQAFRLYRQNSTVIPPVGEGASGPYFNAGGGGWSGGNTIRAAFRYLAAA